MPASLDRLLQIMARLRDPQSGCPWDLEQDFASIAPHTLEEAYEVTEAIAAGDMTSLKDELGDLLFQIVFYAQLADEKGIFDFEQVAAAIVEKMLRRHPHVFGEARVASAEAQSRAWEQQKAEERAAGAASGTLDGVSLALPALTRAVKLQNRVARVGFDWQDVAMVLDKLAEEVGELQAEMHEPIDRARLEDEMGDILFVCANLARKLEIDPEAALRGGNRKFERRFRHIESALAAEGRRPEQASLAEMEALWQDAKRLEREISRA